METMPFKLAPSSASHGSPNSAPNHTPNPTLVRTQLERIVASDGFARSPRMQRFLIYVVEETLAGRASQLCEYGIGLAVFDRDERFEPQLDPIVRNDARRLRSKLLEYYRQPQSQVVTIEIPKGAYIPVFSSSTRTAGPRRLNRIAVSKIEAFGSPCESAACFAQTLGLSLRSGLMHQGGLEVIAQVSVSISGPDEDRADLILQGAIASQCGLCRAMFCLVRFPDTVQIWSAEYEVNPADFLSSEYAIVSQVLDEIAPLLESECGSPLGLVLVA